MTYSIKSNRLTFFILALMLITTLVITAQVSRVVPVGVKHVISVTQSISLDQSQVGTSVTTNASPLSVNLYTVNVRSIATECPDEEHQYQGPHKVQSKHGCGSACLFKIPTNQSSALLAAQSHSLALIEPDQNPTTQSRANTLYRPPIHSFLA